MKRSLTLFLIVTITTFCFANSKEREFSLKYSFSFEVPKDAKVLDIWIPMPKSETFQNVSDIKVDSPYKWEVTQEGEYGNKLAYIKVEKPAQGKLEFSIELNIRRTEATAIKVSHLDEDMKMRLLTADRLGVIDEEIDRIAKSVTADKATDFEKARAIYDYVVGKMDYDKTAPGWGQGDTKRACRVGKGNCTDFHSLFISLCRASKIPARFNYGFYIPKDKSGSAIPHCWAEFYADDKWTPVDCSEAKKNPDLREYYFGTLSENRVGFTCGRDITLEPKQKGEPLNFLINPHIEIDGAQYNDTKTSYTYGEMTKK